jgi:hypothetical protein
MNKLTPEELSRLQSIQKEHVESRLRIADLEIEKNLYIAKVKAIIDAHRDLEIEFSNKYGIGIAINNITGEITEKDAKN